MKKEELHHRSMAELLHLLSEKREALRKAQFSVRQKQLKNIRTIRDMKKTIARILTHLHRQKEEKHHL